MLSDHRSVSIRDATSYEFDGVGDRFHSYTIVCALRSMRAFPGLVFQIKLGYGAGLPEHGVERGVVKNDRAVVCDCLPRVADDAEPSKDGGFTAK